MRTGEIVDGYVVRDRRNFFRITIIPDLTINAKGEIGGIATIIATDPTGEEVARAEAPIDGRVRYRQLIDTTIDIGTNVSEIDYRNKLVWKARTRSGNTRFLARVRGVEDYSETRVNGDRQSGFGVPGFKSRIVANVSRIARGKSTAAIVPASGLEEAVMFIRHDNLRPRNSKLRAWTGTSSVFTVFEREGASGGNGDMVLRTRYYDPERVNPGKFALNARNNSQFSGGTRYRANSRGFLLTTMQEAENAENLNDFEVRPTREIFRSPAGLSRERIDYSRRALLEDVVD